MEKVFVYLEKLKEKAETELDIKIPEYSVLFSLKSDRTLGLFSFYKKELTLKFNETVLKKAGFKKYKSVVLHEFCHLVTFIKYGRNIRPHGKEWRSIMKFYGVENPRATTSDFIEEVGIKAKCKCSIHFITKNIERKILNGYVFRCKECGKKIKVKKKD